MPKKKSDYRSVAKLVDDYRRGDTEARDRLIEDYMGKAEEIASEYFGLGCEEDDLIQAAYEGLLIGIDESRKREFLNYTSFIFKNITRQVRKTVGENYSTDENEYHKNRIYAGMIVSVLKAKRDFILEFHRNPTLEELGKCTGLNIYIIAEILRGIDLKESNPSSIDLYYARDVINSVSDPEFEVLYGPSFEILIESIANCSSLSKKEHEIIEFYRKGIYDSVDLARILDVSRQRIDELKKQISKKCKSLFGDDLMALESKSSERGEIERELCYIKKQERNSKINSI